MTTRPDNGRVEMGRQHYVGDLTGKWLQMTGMGGAQPSPNREPEAMEDSADAVTDWPLLNALLNTQSGATWVSLHHGGGVGIGYAQPVGMVIVADGAPAAARRLERVLWNDPATSAMRHADAGYDVALDCARDKGLDLPGILA